MGEPWSRAHLIGFLRRTGDRKASVAGEEGAEDLGHAGGGDGFADEEVVEVIDGDFVDGEAGGVDGAGGDSAEIHHGDLGVADEERDVGGGGEDAERFVIAAQDHLLDFPAENVAMARAEQAKAAGCVFFVEVAAISEGWRCGGDFRQAVVAGRDGG